MSMPGWLFAVCDPAPPFGTGARAEIEFAAPLGRSTSSVDRPSGSLVPGASSSKQKNTSRILEVYNTGKTNELLNENRKDGEW